MKCKGATDLAVLAGVLALNILALFVSGCGPRQTTGATPPPIVKVFQAITKDVPVYSEWTASTDGNVNTVIRAQVQGYLVSRSYKEGSLVRKGQVLFEIDPRPFRAALEQANAQLAEQEARWVTAKANLERIKPLAGMKAVSVKDFDDASGVERATHAAVLGSRALVDKARLDLGFTRIVSPIEGIAGIAKAQIGNLVGPGSIEELATVSSVNPIRVYLSVSEQYYLNELAKGKSVSRKIPLQLILADGQIHPHTGSFDFFDRQVDVNTGTIKVTAVFSNPDNILRPGQFARVRALTATKKNAILVPQRAVIETQGSYEVGVVGPDNKVEMRPVKVSDRLDNLWVVDHGLKPGEKVVVEGTQKIGPGVTVSAVPFSSPQASTGPGPGSKGPDDHQARR